MSMLNMAPLCIGLTVAHIYRLNEARISAVLGSTVPRNQLGSCFQTYLEVQATYDLVLAVLRGLVTRL